MKRTTFILWTVFLICAGFYMALRKQSVEKPVFVERTDGAKTIRSINVPPGVIRPVSSDVSRVNQAVATRKDVNQKRNSSGKQPIPQQSGKDVIPNEFIFSFKSDADKNLFISLAKANGINILDSSRLGFSVRVRVTRPQDLQKVLDESPVPAKSSSNYYVLSPEIPKKDPISASGVYVPFGSQSLAWLGVKVDNSTWGKGVWVAVLDNGVYSHPALREERIGRVDLVNEALPSSELPEHAGHANAVASIIAGTGVDSKGIAPDATILSVKVMSSEGVGDVFTLAKGIVEAADRGARIINMCLGSYGDSFILQDAVSYAQSKGAVLVAATGNEAVEGVTYPARYDGVVAVSAVDANGQHAYFANRGEEVTISAPGVGVTAAWSERDYIGFSGTSAAVPFISGAIAALLSENPGMTGSEAVDILVRYANDAGAPGRDYVFGNGILDVMRITQRDQKGIYDVAACDAYVPPYRQDDKEIKVIVSAQNRGTETADSVGLKADVNGKVWTTNFSNVAIGQTVSMEMTVDAAKTRKDGGMGISFGAIMNGDINQTNNFRRAVIFVSDTQK